AVADTGAEVGDAFGDVRAPGGLSPLVVDDVDGGAAGLETDHRPHEVGAVDPVQPGGAHHGARVGQFLQHGPLAGQFGAAVGGARAGGVVLGVGGGAGVAGEDVVGGDVDQAGAVGGAGAGELPRAGAGGAGGGGAGGVDGGVGRAVDDEGGAVDGQGPVDGVGGGDVEGGPVEAGDLLAAPGEGVDDVPAEHAGGPGDQPAHDRPPVTRCFSGSHQARLSRYQATVSARPVVKSWRGR